MSLCNICTYLLYGMNDPRGGNKVRTRKDITMKRKITASLLVAVILIFSAETRLISYAADSSEESIVSRVTEFIAVYNTLYNGDAWTDRFPEARKAGTVSVNGTECLCHGLQQSS